MPVSDTRRMIAEMALVLSEVRYVFAETRDERVVERASPRAFAIVREDEAMMLFGFFGVGGTLRSTRGRQKLSISYSGGYPGDRADESRRGFRVAVR